ncbi:MAG: CrcB family protein [Pseudomonadota bacterium]
MLVHLGYVALGGALGSVLRALLGMAVAFPFGTLAVNVLGSLLIGVAFASGLADRTGAHPFLMLGILGGFTTFSTFSLDALKLMQSGQSAAAGAYVVASVVLSALAVWVGYTVAERWV